MSDEHLRDVSELPEPLQSLTVAYATGPAARYRDAVTAMTACHDVSQRFASNLQAHGLRAEAWGSHADELGYSERVRTPWLQDDSHVVCAVWVGERVFTVDFTAAQYGRAEFPLVRELAELPARDPWLLTPEQMAEQMAAIRAHGAVTS